MTQNTQGATASNEQALSQEDLAALIHGGTCPAGYNCQAPDCIECLQNYMDRGGGTNDTTI